MINPMHYWYRKSLHWLTILLLPFSALFAVLVRIRRFCYQIGWLQTYHFPIPVIVVGNITVGGTGKTPFVVWLAEYLCSLGYRPGIVSRGVGGKKRVTPHRVNPEKDGPNEVGDEALLLAQRTNCPVVVSTNRAKATQTLLQETQCDVVISDDGLQHYRLNRDIEIALIDGTRRLGNRCLLPAGPLRESSARLQSVDFVVVNGGDQTDEITMTLEPLSLISLRHHQKIEPQAFQHQRVHAVAGIGHPERFFQTLRSLGFDVIPHAFPDHFAFREQDIDFKDDLPIIMTEKDAVKCKLFVKEKYWYLKIAAKMYGLEEKLFKKLETLKRGGDYVH